MSAATAASASSPPLRLRGQVEHERRRAASAAPTSAGAAAGAGLRSANAPTTATATHDRARDRDRHGALPVDPRRSRAQGRRDGIAAMHVAFAGTWPTYQDLLAEVKSQIHEISAADAAARLSLRRAARPHRRARARRVRPGRHRRLRAHPARQPRVAHRRARPRPLDADRRSRCQSGARSAFAARSLEELGYEDVASLAGGFGGWKQNGFPWSTPRVLSEAQRARYSRHTLIPEVGEAGQLKLLDSTVLLVGAGGLGSPGGPLPGRGRRRHDRDRRRRRRRRVEPAAPGAALDGLDRHAQDRVGASSASRSSTPTCASSPTASA